MLVDPKLLATVFGVVFVAELPDKTALAALLLATRYRPLPVFLGASAALTVQSLVAVAAGGLLSRLPARPVHIGAGILFIVSAVFMWRRGRDPERGAEDERAPPPAATFGRALASSFGVVFVAEWGDLTQLGTAALAARYGRPVTVFVGATLALVAVTAIAVSIGSRLARVVSPRATARFAALVFAVLGAALLCGLA